MRSLPWRRKMKERSRKSEALGLLGLAQRAGAVVKGTDATRSALRRGQARLVILATDGSETQQEKVLPLASAQGVPWRRLGSMDELGGALGTGPLAAVAVTERAFAGEIRQRLGSD
jgi:ribosomal protein L7Ae-like RNA K-turn-binding protein